MLCLICMFLVVTERSFKGKMTFLWLFKLNSYDFEIFKMATWVITAKSCANKVIAYHT